MNPLRKLAKGYEYDLDAVWIVGPDGYRWRPVYAPKECFAAPHVSMSDGYRSTDDIEPGDGLAHTLDADAEEPLREGDRVVVGTGLKYAYDRPHAGRHGKTRTICENDSATVLLDSGKIHNFRLCDLRRERPDKRPAEKKQEPRRANFPPVQYGANGLPEFEPKPEPTPRNPYALLTLEQREMIRQSVAAWAETLPAEGVQ